MTRRVISLRAANRGEWFREVKHCLVITTGPILVAGLLNLLFVAAWPWLAVVAERSGKIAAVFSVLGAIIILFQTTGALFHDDFGEGLPRLARSLALALGATVVAPLAAATVSIWIVALAHPNLALAPVEVSRGFAGLALFVALGEAAILTVGWGAGRLLRR